MGLILRTTHENMPAGAIVTNGRLTVAQMDNNFMFLQSIAGGSPNPVDFTNLETDVIPATDSLYSLGSSASQWKSLHVSGNTIYIGGVTLSTAGDSLVVNSINLGTTASPFILSSSNDSLIINGVTGSIGATGAAGPKGATGAAGPKGATGADGFASLSVVTLTVASASQYISEGSVIVGQPYLITDADPNLYGTSSQFGFGEGTNILLYGVDEKSFTSLGYGKFYSPNYNEFNVWDQGLTYSVDDKVIYGGKVWNLTGTASVGYNDYWSLESDWEVIDYTDTDFYNVVWDEVEYNIVDNYITSRYDAVNNNRVTDSYGTWYFMCETHPIQSFRWGHDSVQNCRVDNSYFGCLNFVSGYIWDVELKNGSMIWDIYLRNNARLQTITLSNFSGLSSFLIDGGHLQNINISNGSSFSEVTVSDSYCYIENITINNSSNIGGFILSQEDDNDCYLSEITVDNDSSIQNFTLHSNNSDRSYFSGIKVDTDSHISGITATASYLENITLSTDSAISGNIYMENSSLYVVELSNWGFFVGENGTDDSVAHGWENIGDGDITITDSSLERIKITNNSIFTGPISITNNSRICELYMVNSYIGGLEQDNNDLYSITIDDSTLENLMLEGHSYIANLEMYSSTLSNTKLSNYSKITSDGDSVYIEDSTLNLITLSNHSYIGYDRVEIINGTNWYDVKLDNYSKIGGYVKFDNSRFGVISLNNNSKFWGDSDDITINDSDVHYISLDNHSEINGYLNIDNSYFQNIVLSTSYLGGYDYDFEIIDSTIQYVNLSNGSWFEAADDDITINNSTVEYITLTNDSRIEGYLNIAGNSNLGYLDLTNGSYFGYGIHVTNGSSLNEVKLENDSRLVGYWEDSDIYIYDNSTMQNIEITNDSYLSGYMDIGEGSYFQNIKIDNSSRITSNIYVYGLDNAPYFSEGSTFENVTVTNGSSIVGNLTVGNYNPTQSGYGYLGNVTVTNGSELGDDYIYVRDRARLEYITINNYSRFNSVELSGTDPGNNPTKMYYIDINNYSYISPNNLELYDGSEIKYLTLDNHSHIMGNIFLHEDSMIKRVQMSNYSKIDGYNEMWGNSEIQYMSMINVSDNSGTSCYGPGFTNFYLDGSTLHGLEMEYSTLGGLGLTGSSKIEGLKINNSRVFNVDISGTSSLLNSEFNNSYLDGDGINPGQYGSLLLTNNSFMENVVIDTVDFPTWQSDHSGISLHNNSVIRNMTLKNMCYADRVDYFENGDPDDREGFVQDIFLDNGSLLENVTITNSGEDWTITDFWFRDVSLNESTITSVEGNLSAIDTITLNDSSSIIGLKLTGAGLYDLYLGEGSSITALEIKDTFNVYSNDLHGASITSLFINNNSYFYENSFYDANITSGTLNLSDIDNCILNNTGLANFTLDGSAITELNQYNVPGSLSFELKNQEFGFGNDSSATYSLTAAVGQNNTIKYQFTTTLNGLSDGYVNIPRFVAPMAGWYIEKAVVDSTTLVVSGTTSFSLGLHESHPESVMDNVDSTVLSNKVKVFDLANGGIPTGLKSNGLDWIGLYIHDGTVTSGTMNIEITLKNTNYITSWWA